MRRFSADYLTATRRGMWDDRSALAPLALDSRTRILDVGCGTGELTRVLREESDAEVVAVDADCALLAEAEADARAMGDATRLPFRDDAFDLVVCQALLINLPDPRRAIEEFARVSADLVACVEPDNAGVVVESSVAAEAPLAKRARDTYIAGVETDVTLGSSATALLREAGLSDVEGRRYEHERTVQPPYDAPALDAAKAKAAGTRIEEQAPTLRRGGLSRTDVDDLKSEWKAMGRDVVDAMAAGEYERRAVVPFYVVAGRVEASDATRVDGDGHGDDAERPTDDGPVERTTDGGRADDAERASEARDVTETDVGRDATDAPER
ncbi:S-adenosylmethionine-dependent methyltransferase [Halarchaeum nitratireducens]|uniref:S-adenosylmethionine-dependent methyltransferase n=1 Tax=Halarchaeum nitratireducens TaxID=489913 RepID=A0A830GAM3_9EURY|nr:class I SAM-dependent methyltransferase [Halarchaeum nitratireducens]GGN13513.1 S-adenosylmethionine-dependent methyltransferase [Halarchaeum nitratireducens]